MNEVIEHVDMAGSETAMARSRLRDARKRGDVSSADAAQLDALLTVALDALDAVQRAIDPGFV